MHKTPKIKQSPKLPPERRREQLLSAARQLFLKKGYRGTSIEEIARRAGLTKGAYYHHFRSKEDILIALLESLDCRLWEHMEQLPDRKCLPGEIVGAFMNLHVSKDISEFRNMVDFWVQALRIPRVRKLLADQYQQFQELIVRKLDTRYGRTTRARRELAVFIMAFFDGLIARSAVNSDLIHIDSQVKLFTKIVEGARRVNN